MKDITIKEILRGTKVGRMQSVGVMQLIPLTSEYEFDTFGNPDNVFVSTSNYGTLEFRVDDDKDVIIPAHAGYIVKQAAQNHAMSHVGLVGKGKRKAYDTACCIQETQSGTIREEKHPMIILPFSLRESALGVRKKREYGKLWGSIKELNKDMGCTGNGHLENFLDKYQDQLENFVAEFEIVDKQIGAIILINGKVVGVEKSPTYAYWKSIFKPLIRECYGSKALEATAKGHVDFANVPIDDTVSSLKDIKKNLKEANKKQEERTKEVIRKLIDDPFTEEKDETLNNFSSYTIDNDQFKGQIVRDGAEIFYASLVTKQQYFKDSKWLEREEFSI